jgi:hypothetical protein
MDKNVPAGDEMVRGRPDDDLAGTDPAGTTAVSTVVFIVTGVYKIY